MFFNNLDTKVNNIQSDGEYYARLIANQNVAIKKLEEEIKDRKGLTKDIIDQASETINSTKEEGLEYYNKYKQNLFEYIEALEQLNNTNNTYEREIGNLSTDLNNEKIKINELRNAIQNLENAQDLSSELIIDLSEKLNELRDRKTILEKDNKYLNTRFKVFRDENNELVKKINDIDDITRDEAKIHDTLDKFKDNRETNMDNLYKKVTDK